MFHRVVKLKGGDFLGWALYLKVAIGARHHDVKYDVSNTANIHSDTKPRGGVDSEAPR